MTFEALVGWRYLRNRRSRMVSLVSWITILGVAFAVSALLITLAVIQGFEREYKRSVLAFNAHVLVSHTDGLDDAASVIATIRRVAQAGEIKGLTPFFYLEGLAVQGAQVRGLAIKAVHLEEYWQLSGLPHEDTGQDKAGLWVGKVFREELGAAEKPLRLRLPSENEGPQARSFREIPISGYFSSGMYDYDSNFALLSFETADKKLGIFNTVHGIEIWLRDPKLARPFVSRLKESLSFPYTVMAWQDLNAHLFGALKLERLVFAIIMGMLILVASFNITGTLTMRVLEKRGDIAILRAMGARWSQIRRLFLCQGLALGWIGGALGISLALLGLEFLQRFRPLKLAADIYFVEFVPSQWRLSHVLWVLVVTTAFSWLATRLALLRLKKLSVIQALGEI